MPGSTSRAFSFSPPVARRRCLGRADPSPCEEGGCRFFRRPGQARGRKWPFPRGCFGHRNSARGCIAPRKSPGFPGDSGVNYADMFLLQLCSDFSGLQPIVQSLSCGDVATVLGAPRCGDGKSRRFTTAKSAHPTSIDSPVAMIDSISLMPRNFFSARASAMATTRSRCWFMRPRAWS